MALPGMAVLKPIDMEEFKALVEAGASKSRLAAKYGRTLIGINNLAKAHGLTIKPIRDVRKAYGLRPRWQDNRQT